MDEPAWLCRTATTVDQQAGAIASCEEQRLPLALDRRMDYVSPFRVNTDDHSCSWSRQRFAGFRFEDHGLMPPTRAGNLACGRLASLLRL
ncbi:MAG: hypothetical protein WBL40_23080 [Terrimicrobiaceae bacterium]